MTFRRSSDLAVQSVRVAFMFIEGHIYRFGQMLPACIVLEHRNVSIVFCLVSFLYVCSVFSQNATSEPGQQLKIRLYKFYS